MESAPLRAALRPKKTRPLRVFAVSNQKGGVGKTTTTINLGAALAAVGRRVLLVDLDPQGNASTGLGVERRQRETNAYHLLSGRASLEEAAQATAAENLWVVPANSDLAGLDLEISDSPRRAHLLREALRGPEGTPAGEGPADQRFDYVLIDSPPSLNLLTINAMTAADGVIVPLQCEFFALEGLSQLLDTIDRVKKTLNRALAVQGVALTMYDRRNSLSAQVAADVREYLGGVVYETSIPRNVRLSEAPSHGKPALLYDRACAGSQAYLRLAEEVLRRERDPVTA